MAASSIGTQAMVTSPHYLASMAGARVLQQGGNAFDAAVAVSACLAVVYPHMTGVGGDSYWLMYHAAEERIQAYNGTGRSGYHVNRQAFDGLCSIPNRGYKSAITVPGMVDSWDAVLHKYGSLSFDAVLTPAIQYAKDGFPYSPNQHKFTLEDASILSSYPDTSRIYVPRGRVPSVGDRFIQKELAATLGLIAAKGRDVFYKGEIAKSIAAYLEKHSGLLTWDDFADHSGEWVEPISTTYRDHQIYQLPPNSQGFAGLIALNILEQYDLQSIGHGTYEYYHLLIEALKLAFRDRNQYLTDPSFSNIPLNRLLDKTYAAELAKSIRMDQAISQDSVNMGSDTAYAAVVDEEGNAVSFIQSLYFEYGSGVVAGDTGVLLQNRGSFFSLNPEHVNRLEPNKRTFHTLMPAMACQDGKPSILYGTQGGEGQSQTQTALITRMIDFGMDPAEAIDWPRFLWGRSWGDDNQELKLEGRIGQSIQNQLAAAGHMVRKVNNYDGLMGHAGAIRIAPSGYRVGGADLRSDGAALGW